MLAALLLAGTILTGAIIRVPPFSTVLDLNYRIKDYWDRRASELPPPQVDQQGQGQGNGRGMGPQKGKGWAGGRHGEQRSR